MVAVHSNFVRHLFQHSVLLHSVLLDELVKSFVVQLAAYVIAKVITVACISCGVRRAVLCCAVL